MKLYCDNCDAEATEEVSVSVTRYDDEKRSYCYTCNEAYTIGVQHGVWREQNNNEIEEENEK